MVVFHRHVVVYRRITVLPMRIIRHRCYMMVYNSVEVQWRHEVASWKNHIITISVVYPQEDHRLCLIQFHETHLYHCHMEVKMGTTPNHPRKIRPWLRIEIYSDNWGSPKFKEPHRCIVRTAGYQVLIAAILSGWL